MNREIDQVFRKLGNATRTFLASLDSRASRNERVLLCESPEFLPPNINSLKSKLDDQAHTRASNEAEAQQHHRSHQVALEAERESRRRRRRKYLTAASCSKRCAA